MLPARLSGRTVGVDDAAGQGDAAGDDAFVSAEGEVRGVTVAGVGVIGDELAVARALADLAHQLLEATAADIEAITHEPAHLVR